MIKELPNGKAIGPSGASNEMCKACKSKYFNELFHKLIIAFILKGLVPPSLNSALMIPLVKDPNKSSNDINNIRPISISKCCRNI